MESKCSACGSSGALSNGVRLISLAVGKPLGLRNIKRQEPDSQDLQTWDDCQEFLDILRSVNWRMNTALDQFTKPCPLNSCRVKAWPRNPILRGGIGYLQQKNHFSKKWSGTCMSRITWYRVIELKMEENRRHWGGNASRTPDPDRYDVVSNCGKKLAYAGVGQFPACSAKPVAV